MRCPKCGGMHEKGASICGHCGRGLHDQGDADVQPATAPLPAALLSNGDADELRQRHFTQALTAATPRLFVTPALIAINVIVFVLMVVRGVSPISPMSDALVRWGAAYGPLTTHGQWWRLLTAVFVHIGVLHLLMNMYVLWTIGTMTERLFGNIGFLVLYLGAGLAASLTSLAWHPLVISAGASGAIFGLYGGLFGFLVVRRASVPIDTIATLSKIGVVFFVVVNLVYGFIEKGVDVWAHLGGFVIGMPLGCALAVPVAADLGARLRRSVLVALSGAALAGIVAVRIPTIDDWAAEMKRLATLEQESTVLYEGSLQKVRSNAMSREELARTVDAKLIPAWNAQQTTIARLRLPEPQRTAARRVEDYMSLKAEAWRLTAEGIRTNDSAMVRDGNVKLEAALVAWQAVVPDKATIARIDRIRFALATADAFSGQMERVTAAEKNGTKTLNDSLGRLKAGRMSPDQFTNTIESQVLRPWYAEREKLSGLKAPDGQEGVAKQIVEYMSLRGDGWRLASQAIRTNDPGLLRQAESKQAEASRIAKSLTGANAR